MEPFSNLYTSLRAVEDVVSSAEVLVSLGAPGGGEFDCVYCAGVVIQGVRGPWHDETCPWVQLRDRLNALKGL